MKNDKIKTSIWLIHEREHIGSSHPSIFTLKIPLWSVYGVREFEPSFFEPGVYSYIKCIGKLTGQTNEFQ